MFTDKQLEEILEVFLKRAQGVNEEYLIRMGEQIREIGELIPSSVNRLVQLKRMHANLDAAKKEIARLAEISAEDLEKVLEKAMETDARFVANTFGNAYKPSILENAALQQILRAQLEVTLGELKNLSMTTISSEAYRNAVDKGIQAVQSGMKDYNTAIRRALREAAEAGVRMEIRGTDATEVRVGYGGKYTRRLDSAVRQNVLDGIRSLSNSVLEQLGEEFGADGVELSAHALCAEDHLPYQGRQYSRKEFDKIQEEDLDRPFGMWNCRHSIHPIILGVSKPAYSEEELAAFRENSKEQIEIDGVKKTRYQWTQEQRKIETAVRRQKDVEICARAAGNAPLRRDAQRNINALMERYGKISEKAGISKQMERMRVEGFKAVSKRELKKDETPLKKTGKHGIIQVYGALNGFSKKAEKHAEQYYASVRKMKTDVTKIARNTGWNESAVLKIKNHVFIDLHMIDGEMKRFVPSYYMAQSWQRLIQGGEHIREQDIVLLKHELLELTLKKRGYSQREAHDLAEAKHNYAKYIPKEDFAIWLD